MNLTRWFAEMKRIWGICPCCGEVFRLSDATIFTRTPPPKTEFDRVNDARDRLDRVIAKFDDQRAEIRAREVARGQREARRRLKEIAPEFAGRGVDPHDVKVLFDPVRYIAFNGMSNHGVKEIEFVDDEPTSKARDALLRSLEDALDNGNVEWATWRVGEDGTVSST